ncbi:methyltransferase domain-containing protein [bacterium SCSIO 12741]|nr:methyltransferase domain-containing protein [bacterium SCSIO 12741]
MELTFDQNYWDERYNTEDTGWDIGFPSTPLKTYFDQLEDKSLRILIPGAGNAYEAEYLHQQGFTNVWVADISASAIQKFAERVPTFPKEHLLHVNFFEMEESFDMMIEQTFFCALHPSEREHYVAQTAQIIKPGGKLVGLLFQIPLFEDHPPFGGNKEMYEPLFSPHFNIQVMETAHNSIEPRQGNELFINLVRK